MVVPDKSAIGPPLSIFPAVMDRTADGPPVWIPYGRPAVSEWQIFQLDAPVREDLPGVAVAFDRLGQADELGRTLVHFYVKDPKLRRQASRPDRYLAKFEHAWGITSPDFSIAMDMPRHHRIDAVWWSRAVGAYFQSRGIRVIPQIDYCFLGVATGSVVAVSNHGCWRNHSLRQGFLSGLPVMIERLEPPVVFVYGTVNDPVFDQLRSKTEFYHLECERTRARRRAA
jgi:Domain of unknown function (DUF4417)